MEGWMEVRILIAKELAFLRLGSDTLYRLPAVYQFSYSASGVPPQAPADQHFTLKRINLKIRGTAALGGLGSMKTASKNQMTTPT
jgi:hypothetical protein